MELIKKIEDRIKELNEFRINSGYIRGKVDAYREILSELKQEQNKSCGNCYKYQKIMADNNCPMNDYDAKHLKPTDFCSKWQKEKWDEIITKNN